MKKILIGIFLLVVLLLLAIYLFIPGKTTVSATTRIHAALPAVSRMLSDNNNWKKFWPGNTPFQLNNQTYTIKGKYFGAFQIDIISEGLTINSGLQLISEKSDSLSVTWNAEYISNSHSFQRLSQYRKVTSTEKNMQAVLNKMKEFMEKTENTYGFKIRKTKVTDSVLVSTRRTFDHQPTPVEIDGMIQSLKKYILANNAFEKNFPMLNVFHIRGSTYEAMTAIAVDRQLPLTKEFAPKFLLKGGNILEGEIKGGPYTIEAALRELENYRADHRYTSPAIPFQLLITDRARETDTAKWITRLYYPVF